LALAMMPLKVWPVQPPRALLQQLSVRSQQLSVR